jgi:hypothetical protein
MSWLYSRGASRFGQVRGVRDQHLFGARQRVAQQGRRRAPRGSVSRAPLTTSTGTRTSASSLRSMASRCALLVRQQVAPG